MKKILLFSFISSALVLSGCASKPQATSTGPLAFNYEIKGCAETDKGLGTKSMTANEEKAPRIKVSKNQLTYSRAISHMCCRQVVLEKNIDGRNIIINENWSGYGCKCECFSEINSTLNNIPAGTYQVYVYEKGQLSGSNILPEKLIISQKVNIR